MWYDEMHVIQNSFVFLFLFLLFDFKQSLYFTFTFTESYKKVYRIDFDLEIINSVKFINWANPVTEFIYWLIWLTLCPRVD